MSRSISRIRWLLALALCVGASSAAAEDQGAQPSLDIRGFGGWAAGYTDNDNIYPITPLPIASNEWELDNTYFTLNLLARPIDRVTILAQPTWQYSMRGKEARLDLAYAEVTLAKDLRLRAGKIKNPLGLYTAVYKVGTLRPFYMLPNSYYRLAPESYVGGGLNLSKAIGSWEIELDALGGQMEFEPSQSDLVVGFDPATGPVFASLTSTARARKVLAGGAVVRPPVTGLQFGGAFYSMELWASVAGTPMIKVDPGNRQKAYAVSAEYVTDKVGLRSEAIFARGYEDDDCWYVEGSYYLTSHWQVAGTFEYGDFKEPPPPDPSLTTLPKHSAVGAALNYWMSPQVVWKANYYRVLDNKSSRPAEKAVNEALAGTIDRTTNVFVVGIHFAF